MNYVLIYYTISKYFNMKKEHIKIFETRKELIEYMEKNNIIHNEFHIFVKCTLI